MNTPDLFPNRDMTLLTRRAVLSPALKARLARTDCALAEGIAIALGVPVTAVLVFHEETNPRHLYVVVRNDQGAHYLKLDKANIEDSWRGPVGHRIRVLTTMGNTRWWDTAPNLLELANMGARFIVRSPTNKRDRALNMRTRYEKENAPLIAAMVEWEKTRLMTEGADAATADFLLELGLDGYTRILASKYQPTSDPAVDPVVLKVNPR